MALMSNKVKQPLLGYRVVLFCWNPQKDLICHESAPMTLENAWNCRNDETRELEAKEETQDYAARIVELLTGNTF